MIAPCGFPKPPSTPMCHPVDWLTKVNEISGLLTLFTESPGYEFTYVHVTPVFVVWSNFPLSVDIHPSVGLTKLTFPSGAGTGEVCGVQPCANIPTRRTMLRTIEYRSERFINHTFRLF